MPTEAELAAQKAEQEKKDAQAVEAKAAADAKAEADAKAKDEATMGKIFGKKPKEGEGKKVVPEAVFLENKKALKEAQAEIQRLQNSGANKTEINKSLKEIAENFDVDEEVITAIANAVKSDAEADIDEKISSRMKPIEEKEQQEKIESVFNEHFAKTLEDMPEYKDVAKKNVIKALSLDPANANKTFAQILEETYGHLIKGSKKPVEQTRARAGAADTPIDYNRARTDKDYFAEIMADPAQKAEYNKTLAKRLRL